MPTLEEEFNVFWQWCKIAKREPRPLILPESTLYRLSKDWSTWLKRLDEPTREHVLDRFRSESEAPSERAAIDRQIPPATIEEQASFEQWIDKGGIPEIATSEARRLLFAQLAFLHPFLNWQSPKLTTARTIGFAGVNLQSDKPGEWFPDDLVRWSSYVIEPQLAVGPEGNMRVIGLDLPPPDLEAVNSAVIELFSASGASILLWQWYWRGPSLGILPVHHSFHFRHPFCGFLILSLLCCIFALGPFGDLLSQQGISAMATLLLFGIPILGSAILLEWIVERYRAKLSGKHLADILSQRILCGVCGRPTQGFTNPNGDSYRLPFALSALSAILQIGMVDSPLVRKSFWRELAPHIQRRAAKICASGNLQRNGKVDPVDRLEDKFAVAENAGTLRWFFAPDNTLPKVPAGLSVLQTKSLVEALLYAAGDHWRWWFGGLPRLLGVIILAVAFFGSFMDLRWIVFPEQGPKEVMATYIIRGDDDKIYGTESQALHVEFALKYPENWLFSLHSGLAYNPVVRRRFAAYPSNFKPGIAYVDVPAHFNGMVVKKVAVLEWRQEFLFWTLSPSRPATFLFPLKDLQR